MSMAPSVLAIDLGGTSFRAAFAPLGEPMALDMVGRWPAPASLAGFEDQVRSILAGRGDRHRLAGIGITIPGLVEGTVARWVPNLPFLDGVDLAAMLAPAGVPLALLLAIGTGIGSAVLSGGRILRGAHGGACSFGWASADVGDPGEDRSGWLERQAAGRALDRLGREIGLADGAALIEAARSGDAAALAAIGQVGTALGTTLAGAVALLDPQAILIAGGVSDALDVLGPPVLAALRRHLPPHLRAIELRAGVFGPRAGLVGAAVAAGRGQDWWRRKE
jgi:glucokinase